jgi:hypothetical protein
MGAPIKGLQKTEPNGFLHCAVFLLTPVPMAMTQEQGDPRSEDIRELVDRPRETLAIEVKGHLDLKDNLTQANLARHICALANFGGGYVVLGFDDHLRPVSLPADLVNDYHRDSFSSIIATYLTPAFLCDVAYVTGTAGKTHPVVRVPSHGVVPICAKVNGPHDTKGKPQGIVSPLIYIRAVGPNGPESVAVSRPEDWEKLIRRCVLADRTSLLGLIESVLTPGKTMASTPPEPLKQWHEAARQQYLKLIDQKQPQWNTPLKANHYQLSYMINTSVPDWLRANDLLSIVQNANTQTRELVWTGWSMFYPFTRPEIAPYFITDEASGQDHHEILESNLLGDTLLDTALPDFWRVSLDGKASLLRAYREDRTAYPERGLNPGQWFRPFFLAREIAELVRHARAMCENFPAAQSVSFRCEWFGLEGRRIADPEADWSKERISKADHRVCIGAWPVADLASRWPAIVADTSSCVVRLFDPEFELPEQWVLHVAPKFRSL